MLDQSKDLQLCFQKYSDLASKGDRYAMMYVADCYLYGWGVDRDFNQYKNLLNQAASMGVVDACERLFYEALANQNYDEINRVFTIWSKREPDEPNDKYSNTYNRTVELYNSLGKKKFLICLRHLKQQSFRVIGIRKRHFVINLVMVLKRIP